MRGFIASERVRGAAHGEQDEAGIRLCVGAGAVDPQGGGRKAECGVEPSALIVEADS
jgi:hypothetical protein